jgi:hypothetical protein
MNSIALATLTSLSEKILQVYMPVATLLGVPNDVAIYENPVSLSVGNCLRLSHYNILGKILGHI